MNVLTKLSETCKLELVFSSDLVNLSDSIDFVFSANPDSCINLLKKEAGIRVTKTGGNLVVLPAPPELIHLRGMVVDSISGEPLPYTHLLIKKAGTGTVTNTDGNFDFKIRGALAGQKIEFSFMGYNHQTYRIPCTNEDSLRILMVAKPYRLNDIFVLPNGTEAVDLVKQAVKNIKRNYSRKTFQMDAFYRNTSFRDTVVSQLIEAALLVEDRGIHTPSSTTSIKLQQIRKSENYLVRADLKLEILDKMWGHKNIFYRAYNQNPVRNYLDDWWYKPLTDYDTFKYEFEGCEWLDSIKVYKIRYIYDALFTNGSRASETKGSDDGGFIYINADDWGILKIEQWWKFERNRNNYGIKDNYLTKKEVSYQKLNGSYYLKYVSDLTVPNGQLFIYENPDAPDKEKILKERQWAEVVLMVNNIITDRKDFGKIRYREKLARDENSYKKNYPYDHEFWANYNILKQNPVQKKAIDDLEWEKPLEQQFKENASNHAENN